MVAVLARGEAALPRRLPSLRRQLQIAAVCHEAIRQLREELGEAPLPAWKDASEDMRASTLAGVTFRSIHEVIVYTRGSKRLCWFGDLKRQTLPAERVRALPFLSRTAEGMQAFVSA